LLIVLDVAQTGVDDDLIDLGDLHDRLVTELLDECGNDFGIVVDLDAAYGPVRLGLGCGCRRLFLICHDLFPPPQFSSPAGAVSSAFLLRFLVRFLGASSSAAACAFAFFTYALSRTAPHFL